MSLKRKLLGKVEDILKNILKKKILIIYLRKKPKKAAK
jgi:hypothetical protein